MKKLIFVVLMLMVWADISYGQTYSKAMVGAGFGEENICLSNLCFDEGTDPELNTDTGYYFYFVPIGVRKPLADNIGVRLESEFSVSRREFDLEYTGKEKSIKVDGDDTRYSFGGNVLVDYKSPFFGITPYAGVGAGLEYSKLNSDVTFSRARLPIQADTHDDFGRYWLYKVGLEKMVTDKLAANIEYNRRMRDRMRDNDSQVNWNIDEDIINAGLTLYW